jgi:hypothetical protein
VSPINNKRPRESNSPPAATDVFDLEDGESTKSQTPDSSMPSSERPMGRRQAKENLKKGGESRDYNLREKFFKTKRKLERIGGRRTSYYKSANYYLKSVRLQIRRRIGFGSKKKSSVRLQLRRRYSGSKNKRLCFLTSTH